MRLTKMVSGWLMRLIMQGYRVRRANNWILGASLAHEVRELMTQSSGVDIEIVEARAPIKPSRMSEALYQHLEQSAQEHVPDAWMHLPSGAFHDAGIMAAFMPSAMLFIPSIKGISHDFAEDSHRDDLVLGCQVMASAVASMFGRQ
ncbi:MAG: M20/M25/M40 family metallo-hydrolase [Betaproteobacteria bacterium]|nr:M20/M25/M40 family metallo-hydrolase [Betaproteobacteria bacterium]